MQKPLAGQKIAVLVANGFNEQDLTSTQKLLMNAGANVRIVSMDNGLVNSWNANGWGLNFAVDQVLNQALAVDFTMLMVPGGARSVEKLKLTAHTKRFLNGFMNANKPVVMFDEAVSLLGFAEKADGRRITGAEAARDGLVEAGAQWLDEAFIVDNSLMTAVSDEVGREALSQAVLEFYSACAALENESVAA